MFVRPRFAVIGALLVIISLALGTARFDLGPVARAEEPGEGRPAVHAQAGSEASGSARQHSTKASEPERVYRYRNAEGREVFTNAGKVAIDGAPLAPVALPELASVDFASASPSQLQELDRSVQHAHDELQSGARCDAIRASLRVPMSTFLWREHLRVLAVAAGLLAAALIVLISWSGRLRGLLPLAPLLGCLYLGFATYARVERRFATLREGLRACSTELPRGETASASAVKERLESAVSLQATIDRAYGERAALSEHILRER